MVERAYESYLVKECSAQTAYRKRLFSLANAENLAEEERESKRKLAEDFERSRCDELADLFPDRQKKRR